MGVCHGMPLCHAISHIFRHRWPLVECLVQLSPCCWSSPWIVAFFCANMPPRPMGLRHTSSPNPWWNFGRAILFLNQKHGNQNGTSGSNWFPLRWILWFILFLENHSFGSFMSRLTLSQKVASWGIATDIFECCNYLGCRLLPDGLAGKLHYVPGRISQIDRNDRLHRKYKHFQRLNQALASACRRKICTFIFPMLSHACCILVWYIYICT